MNKKFPQKREIPPRIIVGLTPKSHLGCFLLTLSLLSSSVNGDDPSPSTVYEILPKFGLPSGLLPDSVTSYSLSDDGTFEVLLEKPCYVQFEYLVYYDKKITGKIDIGSITDLKGIQVHSFLFWFDVDDISVDLPSFGSIYFTVGVIKQQLDVGQFQKVHSCRDNALALCGESLRNVLQLPTATDDVQLLITE